jgi:hypothetical protein
MALGWVLSMTTAPGTAPRLVLIEVMQTLELERLPVAVMFSPKTKVSPEPLLFAFALICI